MEKIEIDEKYGRVRIALENGGIIESQSVTTYLLAKILEKLERKERHEKAI